MNLNFRVEQFCGLSTNPIWQAWLYRFSAELYQELAEHLRTSKGCASNRDKMMELLRRIGASPEGAGKLHQLVEAQFPHLLESHQPEPPLPRQEPPFRQYDPNLLTYPRRLILDDPIPASLRAKVGDFVKDKPAHESVILGDRAYIEYIPPAQAGLAHRIPDKNWLIREWRRGQGF